MKKKLFLLSMLTVCLLAFVRMCAVDNNTSGNSGRKPVGIIQNGDAYDNDVPKRKSTETINPNWDIAPYTVNVAGDNAMTFTVQELDTNARSIYDLESNGIIHYIVQ